jgi:roadblock/LC7 domain-containing protein
MIVEDEVRRLLAEDAEATTWSITAVDVIDHAPTAEVIPLASRRRRSIVLGVVAATFALVVGGALVASRQGRQAPSLAVRTPSVGTGDLAGITLLLPNPAATSGYTIASAEAQPKGTVRPSEFADDGHVVVVTNGGTTAIMVVSAASAGGGNTITRYVTVHGIKAGVSQRNGLSQTVSWLEAGRSYSVIATGGVPESVVVALAESVTSADKVFTVTTPAGYSMEL